MKSKIAIPKCKISLGQFIHMCDYGTPIEVRLKSDSGLNETVDRNTHLHNEVILIRYVNQACIVHVSKRKISYR